MPMLLGVACIDMNLIVALDTVRARSDWADFDARVKRERAACPRVTLTYAQLETLRRGVSEAAVCGAPSSVEMRAESLVLRLVARGDVSDYYSDSLQKELQQKIASAAGVGDDYHYVTLKVEAASVIITAKIDVPTSTTVAAMQTSLSSSLGTADKASEFLGIIIESDPTFETKTEWEWGEADEGESDSAGVVVGAVLGGLVVICLLVASLVYWCRQQNQTKAAAQRGNISTAASAQPRPTQNVAQGAPAAYCSSTTTWADGQPMQPMQPMQPVANVYPPVAQGIMMGTTVC